jgi:hypothetical protein
VLTLAAVRSATAEAGPVGVVMPHEDPIWPIRRRDDSSARRCEPRHRHRDSVAGFGTPAECGTIEPASSPHSTGRPRAGFLRETPAPRLAWRGCPPNPDICVDRDTRRRGLLMDEPAAFRCSVMLYGFMLDLDGSSGVADAERAWRIANPARNRAVDELPATS